MILKILRLFIATISLGLSNAQAWNHGIAPNTSFNGGKFQVNLNFTGIGGDYPFVNWSKNSSGGWSLRDNTGVPAPDAYDQYGYLLPGSDPIVNHFGAAFSIRIPAENYVGNNCLSGTNGTGICSFHRLNGKGTYANGTVIINSSNSVATVTTGSVTSISFSLPQDFRAGMEVPVSGTTGVTITNGTGGTFTSPSGATSAWTVCVAGLTTTNIRLCLNDQVTPLTTTGTAGGTTVVTYGRNACGVTSKCRIVGNITGSPASITAGIQSQDATTPITYRNGIDGIVVGLQGAEETRYEQYLSGTCPGGYNPACQFSTFFINKLKSGNPAVIRALNVINTNESLEVNWADRKPREYFSFGSDMYDRPVSVYAGQTTSTLNAYSLTFGSGAPVDGQQLSLTYDTIPVTVANGANALITWSTSHGLSNGTPIVFGLLTTGTAPGGVTMPSTGGNSNPAGGVPSGFTYFAITTCGSCDATHTQFALTQADALAGTAVTTSSTGSNVVAHASVSPGSATFVSGSCTITWAAAHLASVGEQVSFNGVAAPYNNGKSYFVVSTPAANTMTVSEASGGSCLTPLFNATVVATKNPTLNINGTGPIAIFDLLGYGVGLVKSTQPVSRILSNGGGQKVFSTVTYDGILNIWVKRGGDSSLGNQFFTSGWPPEVFLELNISIGSYPWYSPPSQTVDRVLGITDYNPSLYAMVHVNSPAWVVPRFETAPNETWNGLFPSTTILTSHAVVYANTIGWSTNSSTYQIVGKVASVLGQAAHNEYGGTVDGTKYWAIVGVQSFNFSSATGPTNNVPRLSSADYVAHSTPQSPYTATPAYTWNTHVACAQYFTPGYYLTPKGTTLATANAGGVVTGSILTSAGVSTLNVSSVRVVTSPVFGIGSKLWQAPGLTPTTVVSGSAPNWVLDVAQGTIGSTDINYLASGYDITAAPTFIDSSQYTATFTGSIATVASVSTLTVTNITGYITLGAGSGADFIFDGGAPAFTQISSQLTGTTGGNGTYRLTNNAGTVASATMHSAGVFSLPSENAMYNAIFAFAQGNGTSGGWGGSRKLGTTGYEGSYSPDAKDIGWSLNDQIAALGMITTNSPAMVTGIYGYVLLNNQNFVASGGQFPSLFTFTGISPAPGAGNDIWGALRDIYQPAPTPIWNAYGAL